jgi:hypothetical protein
MIKEECKKIIDTIYEQCSHINWNNQNASGITKFSYDKICEIINKFDDKYLKDVMIGATSDGDFTLEWKNKHKESFYIVILTDESISNITFAYTFYSYSEKYNGIVEYKNEIPEKIIDCLDKII